MAEAGDVSAGQLRLATAADHTLDAKFKAKLLQGELSALKQEHRDIDGLFERVEQSLKGLSNQLGQRTSGIVDKWTALRKVCDILSSTPRHAVD